MQQQTVLVSRRCQRFSFLVYSTFLSFSLSLLPYPLVRSEFGRPLPSPVVASLPDPSPPLTDHHTPASHPHKPRSPIASRSGSVPELWRAGREAWGWRKRKVEEGRWWWCWEGEGSVQLVVLGGAGYRTAGHVCVCVCACARTSPHPPREGERRKVFPLTSVSVSRSQTCPVSGSRILMCVGLCGGERDRDN